jgi:hypothetical protein
MFPACAHPFRFLITDQSDHIRTGPTYRRLFRFAALAASLPKATRVRFGRCAIVRFRFAAVAAFLTFRRAAAFCAAVIQWLFGSAIRSGLQRQQRRSSSISRARDYPRVGINISCRKAATNYSQGRA